MSGALFSAAPEADTSWLFTQSSAREKLLEHLFVGELLRFLWQKGVRDVEVLRSEVDSSGYDLVIECRGHLRHIQLKTSHQRATGSSQNINSRLAGKPSGCVVWIRFDPETLALGPFLWLGGKPGKPLPPLGEKIGRHTKGNSKGVKAARPNIRVVPKRQFESVATIGGLAQRLFSVE